MFSRSNSKIRELLKYFIITGISLSILLFRMTVLAEGESKTEGKGEDKGKEEVKKDEKIIIPNPSSFIQENLEKSYEKLKKLHEEYEDCCGSARSSLEKENDPQEIAGKLPSSQTLRYHITYQEKEKDFSLSEENLAALTKWNQSGQLFTAGSDREEDDSYHYASDEPTSAFLNIPNTLHKEIPVSFHFPTEELYYLNGYYPSSMSCCLAISPSGGGYSCAEYLNTRLLAGCTSHIFSLPPHLRDKFRVTMSDGLSITDKGSLKFISPGLKTVTITGKGEITGINVSCTQGFSTIDSVMTDWQQTDKTYTHTYTFRAIKFLKFGIPGLGLDDDEGGQTPYLDYFIPGRQKDVYPSSATVPAYEVDKQPFVLEINADPAYDLKGFTPKVLVDTGEEGKKSFEASYFPVSVQTIVEKPGPILSEGDGRLVYAGGVGSSVISWRMGKLDTSERSVRYTLTVNEVEVQLDREMRDRFVSPGGTYRVKLLVSGSTGMLTGYHIVWETQKPARWEEESTNFTKSGESWVGENTLSIDNIEDWPKEINKEIRFSASVNRSRMLDQKMLLEIVSGKSPSPPQRVFSFQGKCKIGRPLVEDLKLLTSYDNEKPEEIDELDLFYPNKRSRTDIRLIPYVVLKGVKGFHTFREINTDVQVEMKSTNPFAAKIGQGFKIIPEYDHPDETEIIAKLTGYRNMSKPEGSRDLEIKGDKIISRAIWININQLFLDVSPAQDGKKKYRLMVSGASDMSPYTAVWKADNTTTNTQFVTEGDAFVATLLTGLKLKNVQIVKGSRVLAELTGRDLRPQTVVRLLPANPPATTIKKNAGPEADSPESMDECIQDISFAMEYFGFEPGTTATNYCRQKREKKQQEINREIERINAQNKLVKELKEKGLELVVFEDSMKVGAVITGLPKEYWDKTYCRWCIETRSGLTLDQVETPVQMNSEGLGGCFNIVKGIKEHFDLSAILKVQLVLNTGASSLPVFIKPDRYITVPAAEF